MLSIYCNNTSQSLPKDTDAILYTRSPMTCLSLAVIHKPDMIFLRFAFGSVQKHAKLFELCSCLKKDNITADISTVALLSCPNRELISEITDSGFDYMSLSAEDFFDPDEIIPGLHPVAEISNSDSLYHSICPFIQYELYDDINEIILCGADKGRKVINSLTLRITCCSLNHQKCSYYLDPKVRHEIF